MTWRARILADAYLEGASLHIGRRFSQIAKSLINRTEAQVMVYAYGHVPTPKREPHRRKGSGAVGLVAVYQFVKASYFLYVFWQVWLEHKADEAVGNTLYDPLEINRYFFVLPPVAVFFAIVGFGLFRHRRWARVWAIFPLLFFGPAWLLNHMFGYTDRFLPLQPSIQLAFLVGEVISVSILFAVPSASDAFEKKRVD